MSLGASLFPDISADHERLTRHAREIQEELPRVVALMEKLRSLSAKIATHNAAETLLLDPALREHMAALDMPTLAQTFLYSPEATLVEMNRVVDDCTRFAAGFPEFVVGMEAHNAREEKMWPDLGRALGVAGSKDLNT